MWCGKSAGKHPHFKDLARRMAAKRQVKIRDLLLNSSLQ